MDRVYSASESLEYNATKIERLVAEKGAIINRMKGDRAAINLELENLGIKKDAAATKAERDSINKNMRMLRRTMLELEERTAEAIRANYEATRILQERASGRARGAGS